MLSPGVKPNLTHPRVLKLLRTLAQRHKPGQIYVPAGGGFEVHQTDRRPDLLSAGHALLAVPLDECVDSPVCRELAFDAAGVGWVFFANETGSFAAKLSNAFPALPPRHRCDLDSLVARIEMLLLALATASEHPMGSRRN